MNKEDLVGLTLKEVSTKYPDLNIRLMREDDTRFFGTADLWFDRYNIEVDNGIITSVSVG